MLYAKWTRNVQITPNTLALSHRPEGGEILNTKHKIRNKYEMQKQSEFFEIRHFVKP